ncbi:hypothetical protein SEA_MUFFINTHECAT_8 [Microbacterium phage MuffinTheCat]|nr:hypothetical protein SEA_MUFFINTHECAT_8 [Microbacterium phage MuffinTheCat]
MAIDGKSKYQRAVERARAKGFASPYEERKAKAVAKGFTSPRAERKASEARRGVKRDYRAEREAAKRKAQAEGFRSVSDRQKFKALKTEDPKARELFQKQRVLAHFGISESKFNKIRAENRKHNYAGVLYAVINTYDLQRDKDVHNWSMNRVGYIVAFHAAIVNPKSNYESLTRDFKREIVNGKPKTNTAQWYYLVKYTGYMSPDEFESRYGIAVVREATKQGEVKP